jgi:hypothetical protein
MTRKRCQFCSKLITDPGAAVTATKNDLRASYRPNLILTEINALERTKDNPKAPQPKSI